MYACVCMSVCEREIEKEYVQDRFYIKACVCWCVISGKISPTEKRMQREGFNLCRCVCCCKLKKNFTLNAQQQDKKNIDRYAKCQ